MRERKTREIKDPSIRKKEILDGAMELFTIKGYEQTSMRDIASYLHISLGLCYRYYDSKQVLFEEAMSQYVIECCSLFLSILHDPNQSFYEKMEQLFQQVHQEDQIARYHDFFHQPQHTMLHEQLGIRIAQYLTPYIKEEVERYCKQTHSKLAHGPSFISFLLYGQIGLLADIDMPQEEEFQNLYNIVTTLFQQELIPE